MAYSKPLPEPNQEVDMDAIHSYRMPRANPGMQVLWYRNGTRDRTRVEVAYMLHAGERTATIYGMITGRRVEVVRHVDDPKLQLNQDQRENGAWDFTDDYKEAVKERAELRDRLLALEHQISKLITSQARIPAKPKNSEHSSSNLEKFRELRKKATECGVAVTVSMTKAELEAAIQAKEEIATAVS